jgi:hypothetical protein
MTVSTLTVSMLTCGELSAANRSRAVELLRQAANTLEQVPEASVELLLRNLLSVSMWLIEAVSPGNTLVSRHPENTSLSITSTSIMRLFEPRQISSSGSTVAVTTQPDEPYHE